MSGRGELERLCIVAYAQPNYQGEVGRFEADVNPAELTVGYEVEYDSAQGSGTTNSRMTFKKIKPSDLSLNFFLDGTGANGRPIEVRERVARFQAVTGYNGDIHRPNYLEIGWGTLPVRRCVLKSATITYKLFAADGAPLRAVIAATFTDNADDQTRVSEAQDKSADLTHLRVVQAGDTLPGLCHRIYGDPLRYLAVARANQLDDFRALVPGTRLVFPPLTR